MDWHAQVYGSRGGYAFDSDDDGAYTTYGSYDSELVPERRLRQLGGRAFYRAHEVIDSGRFSDAAYEYTDDGVTLTASVEPADSYAADYEVSVHVDEDAADITDSSCTCPAYGRFGVICKHVIALVMYYDETPEEFDPADGGVDSPTGAGAKPRGIRNATRRHERTSRTLQAFMRTRDEERKAANRERQLALLKEVDALARSGGVAGTGDSTGGTGAMASTSQHAARRTMPIGSVTLRPEIRNTGRTWFLKLRLTVPAHGLSYIVKDVEGLVRSVRHTEFRAYGKKLAFVHTRDAFDERSRAIFDLLDRALQIRRTVMDGMQYYQRAGGDGALALSDDEIAELLDLYVGSEATLDYERPYRLQGEPVRVVDGDPDLGLALERDGDNGYAVRHRLDLLDMVEGHGATFAVVAPNVTAALAADAAPRQSDEVRIHRCSQRFLDARPAVNVLCASEHGEDMFVATADTDAFMRTTVPLLTPVADTEPERSEQSSESDQPEQPGNPPASRGVVIRLPEELLRLRREPCAIEIYLDRDHDGVTCDVQARYGDRRYHALDGVGADTGLRDRDAEQLAVEATLHYFRHTTGPVARIPEHDDDAIYRLLSEGLTVLRGLGEVFSTPAFDGLTAAPRPIIRPWLTVRSGLVEISPIADEIDMEDVPALLDSYRRRRRFHRLRNGAFVALGDIDTSKLEEIADDLGVSVADFANGPVDVPAYGAYYLDAQVGEDGKDDAFREYCDNLRVIDPKGYEVPEVLADVLRPYQVEGFRWLSAVCDKGFGGVLADEMGLGKTIQLLTLLAARRDEARTVGPNLIVCPASLVYNWESECHRFAPGLRVAAVAGAKAQRRALLDSIRVAQAMRRSDVRPPTAVRPNDGTAEEGWQGADTPLPEDLGVEGTGRTPDVLITSYDLLRRDVDEYRGIDFFCMALDEAQYIKNHATKVSQAVRSVTARHRFALTGTPVENRLAELWSIFDFLMPGMLGSYRHFRDRFEQPILSGDEQAQSRLQAFVGPFILRRLKRDVLKDLPDKIENVITVQLQGEQRRLYAALEQRLRASIDRTRDVDFRNDRIQVLAQLTRLRQVCCDPRLVYERAEDDDAPSSGERSARGTMARASGGGRGMPSSAKLDAIQELVESCRDAGRKVLVFSQFTSFLDLIAERLRSIGVAYDVITGATPKRRRVALVDSFNIDDTPVFLISLKAGNTGLNLTGACVVIHADPWWNAAAQDQATDRAHRIGQTRDVNVYQIVARDTIEERILNLQRSKTDLARRFVDEASESTGASMAALTREDLLALLGG